MAIPRCGSAKGVCGLCGRLSTRCAFPGSVVQPHAGLTAAVNHVQEYDERRIYLIGADIALVGPDKKLKSIAWLHTAISGCNVVRSKKLLRVAVTSREW